jgi:trans-aconitate methyltransferase
MEIIRGKQASFMDQSALADNLAAYRQVHLDIGTGDGRFVQHLAQANPDTFVIGLDACRENLQALSRRAPDNALFVIANACNLPPELNALAGRISINFPWGSLLHGLLSDDPALLDGLRRTARPDSALDVRLNAGALNEAGWTLEDGAAQVRRVLNASGFHMRPPVALGGPELRDCPTTWAKRLAFGRDPRAIHLGGVRQVERITVPLSA